MPEIDDILRGQLELELQEAIDTVMAKYGISFQTADTDLAEAILTIAEGIPRG